MKSKKTATKKDINKANKSSVISQDFAEHKDSGMNPENVYINDMLDGMNRLMDFYAHAFDNFIELSSQCAIASKKLQQSCLEYSDDATLCNASATKQLCSCKSLAEAVHTHTDLVQKHMDNNAKHLTKLSELSSELSDKMAKDVFHKIDDINTKIKEACHLHRAKP